MTTSTVGRLAFPLARRSAPTLPPPPIAALVNPPLLAPSIHTDAYEDGEDRDVKLIILAGGIAFWWGERFNSPEHQDYVQWRNDVRSTLIEHNYLTYAPHEAFKGTWNKKAQIVNDTAIQAADLFLVISPDYAIGSGTRGEIAVALRAGVPVDSAPPSLTLLEMLAIVRKHV